jgi:hypothetical protein
MVEAPKKVKEREAVHLSTLKNLRGAFTCGAQINESKPT